MSGVSPEQRWSAGDRWSWKSPPDAFSWTWKLWGKKWQYFTCLVKLSALTFLNLISKCSLAVDVFCSSRIHTPNTQGSLSLSLSFPYTCTTEIKTNTNNYRTFWAILLANKMHSSSGASAYCIHNSHSSNTDATNEPKKTLILVSSLWCFQSRKGDPFQMLMLQIYCACPQCQTT